MSSVPIRIGFVPEHYLLPLHLAANADAFPFQVKLVPFPSGTGHMITALRGNEIDAAIGLTEGWVAGLLNKDTRKNIAEGNMKDGGYKIVGSWVENPLRWAIVTGRDRQEVNSVDDLGLLQKEGRLKVGVSRLGSGSHVMASVLAKERGWDSQNGMEPVVLGPFKELRDGMNNASADFFMWEHYTTKTYWEKADEGGKGEVKWIGEIYTPWPSWHVVVKSGMEDDAVEGLFTGFDQGMRLFKDGGEGLVVKMLGSGEVGCRYGEADAKEWFGGVRFADEGKTRGVKRDVMDNVVKILNAAGVVEDGVRVKDGDGVVGVER